MKNTKYFDQFLEVLQNLEPEDDPSVGRYRSKKYTISYDRIENRDGSLSKFAFIDVPQEDLSFAFLKKTGKLAFICNDKD
jgi:hypothetical protein